MLRPYITILLIIIKIHYSICGDDEVIPDQPIQIDAGCFCLFTSSELIFEAQMMEVAPSAKCYGAAQLKDSKFVLAGMTQKNENEYKCVWGALYHVSQTELDACINYAQTKSLIVVISDVTVELDGNLKGKCITLDYGTQPGVFPFPVNIPGEDYPAYMDNYITQLRNLGVPKEYLQQLKNVEQMGTSNNGGYNMYPTTQPNSGASNQPWNSANNAQNYGQQPYPSSSPYKQNTPSGMGSPPGQQSPNTLTPGCTGGMNQPPPGKPSDYNILGFPSMPFFDLYSSPPSRLDTGNRGMDSTQVPYFGDYPSDSTNGGNQSYPPNNTGPEGCIPPACPNQPCIPGSNQPCTPDSDQPCTPGSDQPCTPDSNQPCTHGSNQPCIPGSDQPCIPGSDQPCAPGSDQPCTPGSNQPCIPGSDQPCTPGSNQPCIPGSDQPCTPGSNQPCPPGSDQPCTPGSNQPCIPGSDQPCTPGSNQPCTPCGQPCISGSGQPCGQTCVPGSDYPCGQPCIPGSNQCCGQPCNSGSDQSYPPGGYPNSDQPFIMPNDSPQSCQCPICGCNPCCCNGMFGPGGPGVSSPTGSNKPIDSQGNNGGTIEIDQAELGEADININESYNNEDLTISKNIDEEGNTTLTICKKSTDIDIEKSICADNVEVDEATGGIIPGYMVGQQDNDLGNIINQSYNPIVSQDSGSQGGGGVSGGQPSSKYRQSEFGPYSTSPYSQNSGFTGPPGGKGTGGVGDGIGAHVGANVGEGNRIGGGVGLGTDGAYMGAGGGLFDDTLGAGGSASLGSDGLNGNLGCNVGEGNQAGIKAGVGPQGAGVGGGVGVLDNQLGVDGQLGLDGNGLNGSAGGKIGDSNKAGINGGIGPYGAGAGGDVSLLSDNLGAGGKIGVDGDGIGAGAQGNVGPVNAGVDAGLDVF